ncbi:hypothetical protein DSUL_20139 [Desulfovibrionales bacterium]
MCGSQLRQSTRAPNEGVQGSILICICRILYSLQIHKNLQWHHALEK